MTDVIATHVSASPLKMTFGGVPVRVATPPMLAEKAAQSANTLARLRNSSSSFSASARLEGTLNDRERVGLK